MKLLAIIGAVQGTIHVIENALLVNRRAKNLLKLAEDEIADSIVADELTLFLKPWQQQLLIRLFALLIPVQGEALCVAVEMKVWNFVSDDGRMLMMTGDASNTND